MMMLLKRATSLIAGWSYLTPSAIPRLTLIVVISVLTLYFSVFRHLSIKPDEDSVCASISGHFKQPLVRHIHQVWISTEIPETFREYQQQCLELNPGYAYSLWDDKAIEDFLRKHYEWFLETYYAYPEFIMRADSARYFILHHFGGIYMDADMKCNTPLDHLLNSSVDSDVILAATAPVGITNNFLVSKPNHPFLSMLTRGLIKSYRQHLFRYLTVMFSTGPFYVYRSYLNYPCKQQVRVLSVKDHEFYMHHGKHGGWLGQEALVIRWLDTYQFEIIICVALILILCIVLAVRGIYIYLVAVPVRNKR